MESIQALLSKGLSPLWSKQIGFALTFLLCLIFFLKLESQFEQLSVNFINAQAQLELRNNELSKVKRNLAKTTELEIKSKKQLEKKIQHLENDLKINAEQISSLNISLIQEQEKVPDKYFSKMANVSFWQNGQYIQSIYDVFFKHQKRPQLWKNGTFSNLYNMSFSENSEFFKYKEQQFKDRKERIFRYCDKLPKLDLHVSHASTDTIGSSTYARYVVDPQDGLGMCRISKVSSSAWLYRFNMLLENGSKNLSQITHAQLVQMHAQSHRWWNLTKEQQVGHFNGSFGDILSFVMVRHPFDRLVSAYYDKIIGKTQLFQFCHICHIFVSLLCQWCHIFVTFVIFITFAFFFIYLCVTCVDIFLMTKTRVTFLS